MTQRDALELLKLGYNVYLTGAAGSGKTHILNEYISYLKSKHVSVGITASTGIAATHMNGKTIHSFCGMGIKDELSDKEISELLWKPYLQKSFADTKVLIIDEVSMLHNFRLDMVNRICQAFKNNPLPFGGIQVVLCGDFFQLPPISKDGKEARFIDKSTIWQKMDLKVCYLHDQYRQEDTTLLSILSDIRENKVTEKTKRLLIERLNAPLNISFPATKLYTHNVDVDEMNDQELVKIKKEPVVYTMTSKGTKALVDALKKSCLAPEQLFLKKGAIVMFVKNNFAKGYVNGTLGEVIGFDQDNTPIVQIINHEKITATAESWMIEENNKILAQVSQIPLRLAWAITVHKSQGMSLDAAVIDLSKAFEPGMGYVALSRVRSLKGIKLLGINKTALMVNEKVLEMDKQLKHLSDLEEKKLRHMSWWSKWKQQRNFIRA